MRKLLLSFAAVVCVIFAGLAQNKMIHGTVTDAQGAPVAGAAVVVSGTGTGVTTNHDGRFALSAPANGTLDVSFLGFVTQRVAVNNQTNIHVTLQEDTHTLDEVIVVAFGQTTKEAFTGSASVVKADDIQKHTTTNVADALVGSVAGLQMRGGSGAPGAGSGSINIRGISSIYAGTEPLVIVDGAPYTASLSNISPSDIESVSVLKDAASAALYGARGASGVIIITTKRSQSREAVVNVDMKWGVNSRAVQDYDVITNPAEYYEAYYAQVFNYAQNVGGYDTARANNYANNRMLSDLGYNIYTVPEGQQLIGMNGKLNPNATMGRKHSFLDPATGQTTDYWLQADNWTDAAYRKSFRQEYTVSVNGGTDRASYYASLGYLNDNGIINYSSYDRVNARLRADYQAKKWLKLGANVGYVHSTQKSNPNLSNEDLGSTNVLYYTSLIAPIYPVYIRTVDADGNVSIMRDSAGREAYDYGTAGSDYRGLERGFMSTGNPLGSNRYDKDTTLGNQLSGTFTLDVDFTSWLKFNSTNNINWGLSERSYYENPFYGPAKTPNGRLQKANTSSFRTNFVQTLNFYKTFGDHDVNVLAGHEYYLSRSRYLMAQASGGFSPDVPELNAFANPMQTKSYASSYNVEGFFVSAQYNYDQRYFASASYRRDASSYFNKSNRWGNFWSVGAAWVINHEKWFNASWVDMLKLKLSYGEQGNDDIGAFNYIDIYNLSASSSTTMTPSFAQIGNPNITWETTGNLNVGVEFGFWKDRLTGSVDFYNKKTSDLLFWLSIPETIGTRGYYGNIGDIRNTGVEVVLSGSPIRTKTVDWNISLNLAHNASKILSLPATKTDVNGGFVESRQWYTVGGPLYNAFRHKYAGVDPETGKALFWVDENVGNSTSKPGKELSYTTDNADLASYYTLGSMLPKLFGGFSTSLQVWKFDLSATFDYQLGGKVYDYHYENIMNPTQASAQVPGQAIHKDYRKAWSVDNPTSNIPRWQYGDTPYASDRFLTDASYLNFQSFTVGFTLPKIKHIQKLRVYVSGENLCFWSKRKGFDPRYAFDENEIISAYSPVRTIIGGVQVTF